MKWTQSEDQDFTEDHRGWWKKGKPRKWDQGTVRRIKRIREELEDDPSEDYWGPSAIEVEYRKRHPEKEVPPLRTIGKILKDLGMTKNQKSQKKRGALRYLRYPEHTIYEKLGVVCWKPTSSATNTSLVGPSRSTSSATPSNTNHA